MINAFYEHRQHFQKQLVEDLSNFLYQCERYQINFSVLLAYTPKETMDLTLFNQHLRECDKLIFFQPNLCAIIFFGTGEESGIKAANNLLYRTEEHFFDEQLYMAIVTTANYKEAFQMIHDLFDIMIYSLSNHMDKQVVDNSQIIQHD